MINKKSALEKSKAPLLMKSSIHRNSQMSRDIFAGVPSLPLSSEKTFDKSLQRVHNVFDNIYGLTKESEISCRVSVSFFVCVINNFRQTKECSREYGKGDEKGI